MTPKAKIAITIPAELLDEIREAVDSGRAANVSAYVADAVEQKAKRDGLDALLDEMLEETGGPMTDEERVRIDRLMGWQ